MRFVAEQRIRRSQEIAQVFERGRRVKSDRFVVHYCKNTQTSPRLAVIAKKSIIKHSVKRNLVRRIVRESFRNHQKLMKGLDIIVTIRSECHPLENKMIRSSIDCLWPRLCSAVKN